MIATSHVIIGGAVGMATKDPALGLIAGFVSHLICDAIPHLDVPSDTKYKNDNYDEPIWTKKLITFALIDSLVAFFLTLFIWFKYFHLQFFAPYAWGALGAYLPDFLDNVPLWRDQIRNLPLVKQFHKLHLAVHDNWRLKFPMPKHWLFGTVSQIIFIIPCLWYILR